jgi:hypothetical protein
MTLNSSKKQQYESEETKAARSELSKNLWDRV